MSRIGKNPVTIPDGVSINIAGVVVTAKGKLGELSAQFTDDVEVTKVDNLVYVKPRNESQDARKMWGTSKSVINNLVVGVSEGFTRKLEINGVGFRAQVQGKSLNLQLGFSHDIDHAIPKDVKIECPKQNIIKLSSFNKEILGATAAKIRSYRKPEPFKGKGIKYDDEFIFRKEGKKK